MYRKPVVDFVGKKSKWKVLFKFLVPISLAKVPITRLPFREKLHVASRLAEKRFEKHGKFKHPAWKFHTEDLCSTQILLKLAWIMKNSYKMELRMENLIHFTKEKFNGYLLSLQQALKRKNKLSTLCWRNWKYWNYLGFQVRKINCYYWKWFPWGLRLSLQRR